MTKCMEWHDANIEMPDTEDIYIDCDAQYLIWSENYGAYEISTVHIVHYKNMSCGKVAFDDANREPYFVTFGNATYWMKLPKDPLKEDEG